MPHQRQDALTDQMFDVMCSIAGDVDGGFDGRRIAAWLLRTFFQSNTPVTASFYLADDDSALTSSEINFARYRSTALGCYDAGDWLRNQAEQAQNSN